MNRQAAALATGLLMAGMAVRAQDAPADPATTPATAPASSPAPAPATASTQAELKRAIAENQRRRSSAIGGIVFGGVLIVGGIVVSAVNTANESVDKQDRGDYSDTPIQWGPTLIGIAIAAPVLWASISTLTDAQRKLRHARRQSLSLAPSPDGRGGILSVALAF